MTPPEPFPAPVDPWPPGQGHREGVAPGAGIPGRAWIPGMSEEPPVPGTAGTSRKPLKGSLSPARSLGFDPSLPFVPLECSPVPPVGIPNPARTERVGKDRGRILWEFQPVESLGHGMVWVGMGLKSHPLPPQRFCALSQISPIPVRARIEHSRPGIRNSPPIPAGPLRPSRCPAPQTHPKSLFQRDPRSQNPPGAL